MTRSGPSWETIDRMERARWARLVYAHSDHEFVGALRRKLERGGRLTQADCAELGRLAVLHGWKLPVAGSGNTKRGRRRRRR